LWKVKLLNKLKACSHIENKCFKPCSTNTNKQVLIGLDPYLVLTQIH
jgi:hypothetical protein